MPDKPETQHEPIPAPGASDQATQPDASVAAVEVPPAEAQATGPDVAAIQRERDDYYDRLLRKTAEFENYRKRTDKERREAAQYAASDLLEDLLPVIDDFERALQADARSDVEAYRKGVELIHKRLLDLLASRGAVAIDAVGKDFDPRFHQAITHEESPGHRDGEVIEEVRRGYMYKERLLRPAMVKVAKA